MKLDRLHAELKNQYEEVVRLSKSHCNESIQRRYTIDHSSPTDKTTVSVTINFFAHDDNPSSADNPVWKAQVSVMPIDPQVEGIVKDFFSSMKTYSLKRFNEHIFREFSINLDTYHL